MARPSNSELVRRAARTRAAIAEADPKSTEALVAIKRRLLQRFRTDVDFWYEQARGIMEHATTKDDEPKVKLVMHVLRSFLAEQRVFPVVGDTAPAQAPVAIYIGVPAGAELKRGTLAARQEAIEVRASKTGETAALLGAEPPL